MSSHFNCYQELEYKVNSNSSPEQLVNRNIFIISITMESYRIACDTVLLIITSARLRSNLNMRNCLKYTLSFRYSYVIEELSKTKKMDL